MKRVTRAEAARRLGVNKSTISRWVAKHPALLDENGLVSVEELDRHRAEVVNPALQTRTGEAPENGRTRALAPSGSVNDHRARKEQALATEAELDLADRLGRTLRRDDVEHAVSEAGEVMRQRAARIVRERAEALARIDDVRAMERALHDLMRSFLDRAAEDLAAAALRADGADAA